MAGIIEVKNLIFEYGATRILHDISFTLAKGSVTALVGPNGAGKTTLLRCLTGLERPVSGSVYIEGISVYDDPRRAHGIMGYLSDFFGLYDDLTVRQCLTYMAWCHKLPQDTVERRVNEVAAQVELLDKMDAAAETLSRGYRQRLGVGLALLHDPAILILDEPASGMDPEARIGLSHLMHRLRERQKTILVSSHILNELEDYCTDMLIIRGGRVIDHVKLKEHQQKLRAVIKIGIHGVTAAHLDFIKATDRVAAAVLHDGQILCEYDGDPVAQEALLRQLVKNDIPVFSFYAQKERLQDLYINTAHAPVHARGDKQCL